MFLVIKNGVKVQGTWIYVWGAIGTDREIVASEASIQRPCFEGYSFAQKVLEAREGKPSLVYSGGKP